MTRLEPGDVVERYEVVRLLGEGGMAKVVLVRHTTLDTLHALKVLTVSGRGLTERLVSEGRAQAALQHPNVVRVSDVIDVEGQPGLVMDYVDGPDLDQWIQEVKPDPKLAEEVFRGVLSGVTAAHHAGLIHRDLKPANVLMARTPEGTWCPKVADFGLAKALEGDSGLKKTRTGLPMGTPAYMSPEQIRDAAGVDERADVFSLGCILHELVAHEPAFEGDDAITIFNRVLSGERKRLATTLPKLPAHIDAVVEGCLRPDRDTRLPSCDAVRQVLDGERSGRTVSAAPPRLGPPARLPTWAWMGALSLVVMALGFFTAATFLATAGVVATTLADDPDAPCAPREGPIGWVRHGMQIGAPRAGKSFTNRVGQPVQRAAAGRPKHEEVVCFLPVGAKSTVLQREGPWIQLDGRTLELPPPVE